MVTKEDSPSRSAHLNEVTKLVTKLAGGVPTLLGHASEYLKAKAFFPVLFVLAVQAIFTFCDHLHVQARLGNLGVPSTVDSTTVGLCLVAAALAWLAYYFLFTPGPALLLDFACFKPDDSCKVSKREYMERAHKLGYYSAKSLEFQEKVLALSGLGDETYAPPSVLCVPPDRSLKACHAETQKALFSVVDELFAQGTVQVQDVNILVLNCSMYSPAPSLAGMVMNHCKMGKDVEVFNLGGMGCSAGLLALELGRKLLQGRRNSYALVLSVEGVSAMLGYTGDERSMLVGNCLFRYGASGVLLSNRRADRWRAKYELQHLVRTHGGADDASHRCARTEQDNAGNIGVSLSKDLMRSASSVLKDNITDLAPKILPWSEKAKFAVDFVTRRLVARHPHSANLKPYVPDFTKAVSHFVVHPGGRPILDGVAEKLALDDWYMEPSRMTLHRFGNVSSCSVWYVLAYLEAKDRVKQGDTVWQISLGSGMKCNSAVWKSLRSSQRGPSANVWATSIDKYPMEIEPAQLPPPKNGSSD